MKTKKQKMKTTNILLLGLIVVIVVAVIATFVVFGPGADAKTVQVSGNAEIEEEATISTLYLGYQNTEDTAQEAEQKNAEIVSAIRNSLVAQGLSEEDIETDSYYLNQEYEWTNGQRISKGYRAYHRLKIKVEGISVGKFITAAVNSGANFVDNVQYSLPDEEMNALKAQALEQASQNARAKAEGIAQGLNLQIKGIRTVQDTSWDVRPWFYAVDYRAEAIGGVGGAITTPAPVDIGKVTVVASVQVVFEIA